MRGERCGRVGCVPRAAMLRWPSDASRGDGADGLRPARLLRVRGTGEKAALEADTDRKSHFCALRPSRLPGVHAADLRFCGRGARGALPEVRKTAEKVYKSPISCPYLLPAGESLRSRPAARRGRFAARLQSREPPRADRFALALPPGAGASLRACNPASPRGRIAPLPPCRPAEALRFPPTRRCLKHA